MRDCFTGGDSQQVYQEKWKGVEGKGSTRKGEKMHQATFEIQQFYVRGNLIGIFWKSAALNFERVVFEHRLGCIWIELYFKWMHFVILSLVLWDLTARSHSKEEYEICALLTNQMIEFMFDISELIIKFMIKLYNNNLDKLD